MLRSPREGGGGWLKEQRTQIHTLQTAARCLPVQYPWSRAPIAKSACTSRKKILVNVTRAQVDINYADICDPVLNGPAAEQQCKEKLSQLQLQHRFVACGSSTCLPPYEIEFALLQAYNIYIYI